VKILVCMKQVPQKDAPLKLNESGTWIREDVSYEVNEPMPSPSKKLASKEKHTASHVITRTARASQVLREPRQGRDRAIHLEDDALSASTPTIQPAPSPPPSRMRSST